MITIHKFQLPVESQFSLRVPQGARQLSIQMQGDQPTMWAVVDTDAPPQMRDYVMYGTGHDIEMVNGMQYVGTVQLVSGLVFHYFQLPIAVPCTVVDSLPSA